MNRTQQHFKWIQLNKLFKQTLRKSIFTCKKHKLSWFCFSEASSCYCAPWYHVDEHRHHVKNSKLGEYVTVGPFWSLFARAWSSRGKYPGWFEGWRGKGHQLGVRPTHTKAGKFTMHGAVTRGKCLRCSPIMQATGEVGNKRFWPKSTIVGDPYSRLWRENHMEERLLC